MSEVFANSFMLNAHSYLAGERIVCRLTVASDVPKDRVTNLSLDAHRIEDVRDQFAFGFGMAPRLMGGSLEVEHNLPANLRTGLYVIGAATLTVEPADTTAGSQDIAPRNIRVAFSPVIFQVRTAIEQPASPEALAQQVALIMGRRRQLAHKPFIVEPLTDATGQPHFLVFVFGVGCLIHQPQRVEGFSILPAGQGLSHRSLFEVVNRFLEGNGFSPLPFIEATEQRFAASTPVFAIAYNTVVATDPNAALEYCRLHAERVFSILGIDRGQKPRAFAYVATQYDTQQWWHWFEFPGYRGNLLSDLNPVKTANEIERLLPRLDANPFFRLIVSTYGDATAEPDYGFALLRFWSVLELVADRNVATGKPILHPDGTEILNAKGKPETTDRKYKKVYAYILASGAFEGSGPYFEAGITLWDMVRATYAIRNAIAHEGQFDLVKAQAGNNYQRLAARFITLGGSLDPLHFIKMQAQRAVWREA